MEKIRVREMEFVDEQGRIRLFHGVNIVCKDKSLGYVYKLSKNEISQLRDLGFNVIRLGIIWDGLEPEPGVYNEEYLGRLEEIVNLCAEHEIYVILDMHQDLYSVRYSDGAPEWATITDGLPEPSEVAIWSDAYMSPAVMRAFDHFWANDPAPDGIGLQDHFAKCWQTIARRFKNRPEILGYDLLNEPSPGSLSAHVLSTILKTLTQLKIIDEPPKSIEELTKLWSIKDRIKILKKLDDEKTYRKAILAAEPHLKKFDKETLTRFYERIAKAIRTETPHGIIFLEGNYFSNAGIPSHIDPIRGEKLQAYSPHIYDLVVDTPYIITHFSERRVKVIAQSHHETQKRLKMPVIVGEWGAFGRRKGIKKVCEYLLNTFDELKWSWTYWAWEKEFTKTEAARLIARPYPEAVAGELISFSYKNGTFTMKWIADNKTPTIVRLPKEYKWSEITIKPKANYEIEEEIKRLMIKTAHSGKHILVIKH